MKAWLRLANLKARCDMRSRHLSVYDAWYLGVLLVFAPLIMLAQAVRAWQKAFYQC